MIWVYGKCALKIKAMEKEMATHSSILAWQIPGTEEPGVLQSMGGGRCQKESDTTQQLNNNNKIERTDLENLSLSYSSWALFFGLGEYLISLYRTIFLLGVFNIYRSLQIAKIT